MSIKILIADDEAVNRELLKIILEKEGYSLFFAEDGEEALTVIYKERIELVLLDLLMPKMDGIEVIKAIKKDPQVQPKIIIITALAKDESYHLIKEYKADGYIRKPYDIVELKQSIRLLIEEEMQEKIKKFEFSSEDWRSISINFLKEESSDIEAELNLLLQLIQNPQNHKKFLKNDALTSSSKCLKNIMKKYNESIQ